MVKFLGFSLLTATLCLAARAMGATLYITNTKSESASIIDTDTLEVVGSVQLGQGKPNRIVFHPDGKTAWVVYDKSHDLGVIDAESRKLVRRVKIGGNPYNLAFTPDGRYLLVLDWSSDTSNDEVIFYDLKEQKIDGRVEVSTWPAHAIFSRDGKLLYVSGETAGDVTVIDVAQRKAVGRIIHGGSGRSRCPGSSTRPRSRSMASTSTQPCGRPTRSPWSAWPTRRSSRSSRSAATPISSRWSRQAATPSSPTATPTWSA